MQELKNFYIDEPCIIGFWIGELGWFLQRYQGLLRYVKQEQYKDHKVLLFANPHLHAFVSDFITYTIDLPDWFKELNLEKDCFEAPDPKSASVYTPPDIYASLINSIRELYNVDKAIEVFPLRGCNFEIDKAPQIFRKYEYPVEVV